MSVNDIINERDARYGGFQGVAGLSQSLKEIVRAHAGWGRLSCTQAEALEMVIHKVARIVNGDPDYPDSWDDIAGYAARVSRELKGGEG